MSRKSKILIIVLALSIILLLIFRPGDEPQSTQKHRQVVYNPQHIERSIPAPGSLTLHGSGAEANPLAAEISRLDQLLTEGKYRNALQEARSLAGEYPANSQIQLKLADVLLQNRQWREAEPILQNIVRDDINNAHAHYLLGLLYWQTYRYQYAVKEWELTQGLTESYRELTSWLPLARKQAGLVP